MPALRHLALLPLALFALPAFAASGPALAGIPVDFILFALTLLGVALFHNAHALRRADRDDHHRAVQDHLHRLQDRRRAGRPDRPHRPRMGDAGQPVLPADGLRAAVAAFREEPRAGHPAEVSARRLEGRLRAAAHGLRALQLPRQHRRRADRRRHGASVVQGQSACRLPGRHRCRFKCRWLGFGGWRHDDHDDLDFRGFARSRYFTPIAAASVAVCITAYVAAKQQHALFADDQRRPRPHQG